MSSKSTISLDVRFSLIDLIHEFYLLIDSGHASKTAALFAADGSLTFGTGSPKPGTICAEEITLAMQDRERLTDVTTRHVISNVSFAPDTGGRISAHYLMTLFRADAGPRTTQAAFVADVDEIFVRVADEWKIFARTITPVFSRQ